jgi:phosphatidylserine decarboxylase
VDAVAPLVWPCDGSIVTAGAFVNGRIEKIKGRDYAIADLLGNAALAGELEGGTQATIYLAPRDYHRVHAPFDGRLQAVTHFPGKLFPVNPGACRAIDGLFPINERLVFAFRLADGRPAAVVMVAALNVGDILCCQEPPRRLARGNELARFGLGSTVVVIVGTGGPGFGAVEPATVVRMGEAAGA